MQNVIKLIIMIILVLLFSGITTIVGLNFHNSNATGTGGLGEVIGNAIFLLVPSLIAYGTLFWWILFRYL
ncbi:MAG: hypothetical protein ACOCRK_08810 [bacterium]